MAYRKIANLYKDVRILDFKECYAMEKVHGTSAHVSFTEGKIKYFSGGAKHENFVAIFNEEELLKKFEELGHENIIIYGEAYGGKMQGMRDTYGEELVFTVFEVNTGGAWLNVENSCDVANKLGFEFMPYDRGPATVEWLDSQRDLFSRIAKRRGIEEDKIAEGIVIKPVQEYLDKRGNRVISKHKRDEFKETKTKREISPEELKIIEDAEKIAEEWVVDMRLKHVLDKLELPLDIKSTGDVIKAMINDVQLESVNEVIWSKNVEKQIGRKTAQMFKQLISKI